MTLVLAAGAGTEGSGHPISLPVEVYGGVCRSKSTEEERFCS